MTQPARAAAAAAKPAFIIEYMEDLKQGAVWFKFGNNQLAKEFAAVFKEKVGKPFLEAGPHQNKIWSHFTLTSAGPVDPQVQSKIVSCVSSFLTSKGGQALPPRLRAKNEPRIQSTCDGERFWFRFESKEGAARFAEMFAKDVGKPLLKAQPDESEEYTHYCFLIPIPDVNIKITACMSRYIWGPEAADDFLQDAAGSKLRKPTKPDEKE